MEHGRKSPSDHLIELCEHKLRANGQLEALAPVRHRSATGSSGSRAASEFRRSLTGTIALLNDLVAAESDTRRRDGLRNGTYEPDDLTTPVRDWLILRPDDSVAHLGDARLGRADVARIRQTIGMIREADNRHGGDETRSWAVGYLSTEVLPRLSNGTYSDEVGRELFSAAAELANLTGWISSDAGMPGLAQRYRVQALRLAKAAGDVRHGACVLAGMGEHATYRAFPREAVDLALAGQQTVTRVRTPALEVRLNMLEARGYAQLGDERACTAAKRRAEAAFSRIRTGQPYGGGYDEARLAEESARCHLSLNQLRQAEDNARQALAWIGGSYRRRRACVSLLLADVYIQDRQVEQAGAMARSALNVVAQVNSHHSRDNVATLQRRFRPFGNEPEVQLFNAEANRLLGLT